MKLFSCSPVVDIQVKISYKIHAHIQKFIKDPPDILLKCHKYSPQSSDMQHCFQQDTGIVIHSEKILKDT